MDGKLRNLPCKRIQVDEAWAFIYAKEKNVATAKAALYMYAYNFIKPHRSLKNATPAMAAGLSDWRKKIEDIVALLDADYEATRPKTRGAVQEAHGVGRHGCLTVVRVPLHCLCVN